MPRPLQDLTGQSFGAWTVLQRDPEDHPSETYWICQCSCGARASVAKSNLVRGRSTQCKACRNEASKKEKAPKPKYTPVRRFGANSPRWKGESVGYSAAHSRVRRSRGKAELYSCVDCGQQAQDWSFTKPDCDGTMTDNKGRPYCTHPEHYEPRCRDCHNKYDH